MSISVLILAKNEEEMIADCISQLDFAGEIIVLDQSSTDRTAQIAEHLGAKVYVTDEEDFSENRNLLKNKSKHEWLLYLDADERINQVTINEILQKTNENNNDAFYFPRKNIMLGKWLKHGGWWPDYVPRLFKKNALVKWTGEVHESPVIEGTYRYMTNHITHITARSVSQMFNKSIKWAKIEAGLYKKANAQPITKVKITKAIVSEFTKRYIVKKGFLDAKIGFIQAIYQSLHAAIVLTYLWEIQNKSEEKSKEFKNE